MAETSTFTKLVMWFFVGIGVLTFFGFVNGQRSSGNSAAEAQRKAALTPEQRAQEAAEKAESDSAMAAKYLCRTSLKRSLNDPDSVKWDESPGWHYERQSDGTILLQPRARARNAFGAYVLGVWECVVLPEGENVRLISLKQISP